MLSHVAVAKVTATPREVDKARGRSSWWRDGGGMGRVSAVHMNAVRRCTVALLWGAVQINLDGEVGRDLARIGGGTRACVRARGVGSGIS